MARAKRHYIPGHVWHTPVKQKTEKSLWEDFRHGMMIGTVDPEKVLEKAAGLLNCDLDYIRHYRRIPKLIKEGNSSPRRRRGRRELSFFAFR